MRQALAGHLKPTTTTLPHSHTLSLYHTFSLSLSLSLRTLWSLVAKSPAAKTIENARRLLENAQKIS